MKLWPLLFVLIASQSLAQQTPPMIVLAASQDAEGMTQADFTPDMLKAFEKSTVQKLKEKTQAYMKSQGDTRAVPPLHPEAHYVDIGKQKVAVVRVTSPKTVNQVYLYGIVGNELKRVACTRTGNYEVSIPLFSGPCGEKITEVFGSPFKKP